MEACQADGTKLRAARFLAQIVRAVLGAQDPADCSVLREVVRRLILGEALSGQAEHPLTTAMVTELFLQLTAALRDAPASQNLAEPPTTDQAVVTCGSAHVALLHWLFDLFLELAKTAPVASLAGVLFPSSIVKLLIKLVRVSDMSVQFTLLVTLGNVLSLPGLTLDTGDAVKALFDAMNALWTTESASVSPTKPCSSVLQALIQLNVSLEERLKLSEKPDHGLTIPPFIETLKRYSELLAFLQGQRADLTTSTFEWVMSQSSTAFTQEDFVKLQAGFNPAADAELVEAVNRYYEKNSSLGVPPTEQLTLFKQLSQMQNNAVDARFQLINAFNTLFWEILPFANLSQKPGASTLTDLVRQGRCLLWWSRKNQVWREALQATRQASEREGGEVRVNVLLASELAARKKVDNKLKHSLFGQVFQELRARDPRYLRVELDARAWSIKMVGLNAIDAGGPYREVMDKMCNELMSSFVPLFVLCPNAQAEAGDNRDKWVPKSLPPVEKSSERALRLSAYEFLGQLMGLAIRSQNLLPLSLPPLVWKLLVGESLVLEDIRAVDLLSYQLYQDISNSTVPPEMFEYEMEDVKFEVTTADGLTVPLVPGGSSKQVNYNNRHKFLQALLKFRLNEFNEQCHAIRRGLATVVPYQVLRLLSWRELENQVVGSTMDLELWQRQTYYECCSAEDAHIRIFWQMIRERFDDKARQQFLNFVWGRSRLPTSAATWGGRPFKIQDMGLRSGYRSLDDMLPITHTCFFSIELPRYSTLDIMTERITYAMVNCSAIDGDGAQTHDQVQTEVESDDE
eukprot:TRINITY_DN828_c0_g1_i6.p1 TRINITY_DN828_c0_g1~~TRINITY_DN828_c0_g1_i6.p1  ORF type:complete len:913 (+),score=475.06 TRINITY_DN828_c0_g1_i6:344-2740(+)